MSYIPSTKFMDDTPDLKVKQFSSNDKDTLIETVAWFVRSDMDIKSVTVYSKDSDAWYGFVVYKEWEEEDD